MLIKTDFQRIRKYFISDHFNHVSKLPLQKQIFLAKMHISILSKTVIDWYFQKLVLEKLLKLPIFCCLLDVSVLAITATIHMDQILKRIKDQFVQKFLLTKNCSFQNNANNVFLCVCILNIILLLYLSWQNNLLYQFTMSTHTRPQVSYKVQSTFSLEILGAISETLGRTQISRQTRKQQRCRIRQRGKLVWWEILLKMSFPFIWNTSQVWCLGI